MITPLQIKKALDMRSGSGMSWEAIADVIGEELEDLIRAIVQTTWALDFKLRYVLKDDGVTFKLECEDLADSAASVAADVLSEIESIFAGVSEVYSGTL